MHTKQDLLELSGQIGRDLRAAQAKLGELQEMIASSSLPTEEADKPKCPICGPLGSVRTEQQLSEHMENVHS